MSPQKQTTLLIVDDDPVIRQSLQEILSYHGYQCLEARDGKEALSIIQDSPVDLILLDLQLPRLNGMEILKRSLASQPDLPVIIISGHGTIQKAVEATKLGAYDFLEKPLEAERTLLTIRHALEKKNLKVQRDYLLKESRQRYRMVGSDPKIQKVFELIDRAARVDSKVLITGEPGTGKELVARAIHFNSDRATHPFVPVNCSAIPETLIESELFGHKKGTFTGAVSDRIGKFEQAEGGTLFLDEIGDMSLMMQAKVLRVIEDGLVEPVGGRNGKKIDVRIIAATNKDLKKEIEAGNFRRDLFFRLNVIPIYLPPLRERKDDIKPLAEYFLEEICAAEGLPRKSFAPHIWPLLINYEWPGNVRELRNVIERAAVLNQDPIIDTLVINEVMHSKHSTPVTVISEQTLREARERFEKDFILRTLVAHDGKINETAKALGIERSHLWKKMKQYGIKTK